MSEPVPPTPPRYAWPKYVLGAVALFFTVCIVWTVKEVGRLRRAKEDAQDMNPPATVTNAPARR